MIINLFAVFALKLRVSFEIYFVQHQNSNAKFF